MNKALEGIRVIDIGQLVQGPQAGATLHPLGRSTCDQNVNHILILGVLAA